MYTNDLTNPSNIALQTQGALNMYGPATPAGGPSLPPLLPPRHDQTRTPHPPQRPVDNRPAWMTSPDHSTTGKRNNHSPGNDSTLMIDEPSDKRGRLCVVSAAIFISKLAQSKALRQMPLDLDNGLPGILVRVGLEQDSDMCFMCHVDSCAAMNTGNLLLHQYLITQHPHLVAEYIQYDDSHPFEPIQLQCAVDDNATDLADQNKLTAIVRYHTPYTDAEGKPVLLSFGLGAHVAVRSILGKPTLKAWQCSIDFGTDKLICPTLGRRFDMHYETARQGLPSGIAFQQSDFRRPQMQGTIAVARAADALLSAVTDGCDSPISSVKIIDDETAGYLQRRVTQPPQQE